MLVLQKRINEHLKLYTAIAVFFLAICTYGLNTFAGDLADTQLVKGSMKLGNDITTILLIASPIVGILCIIYFQIRKGAADEQDQKQWHNRTVTTITCIIVAVTISGVIKIIVNSYMGGNI